MNGYNMSKANYFIYNKDNFNQKKMHRAIKAEVQIYTYEDFLLHISKDLSEL